MNPKKLERNIIKYNLYKIFTKRVFLPLISIYLIDVGHVSLLQLGILASVAAITNIVMEVPTGYLADYWGHKKSIVFGSFLTTISVIPYIFYPSFVGGLIASIGFFAGYAFTSGTLQAFIHETLLALKREGEYSKIMGRAQSYGLMGNVILISLIPLSYQLDNRLPFILGFFCLLASFLIALSLNNPPERLSLEVEKKNVIKELGGILKKTSWVRMLIVFLIFGIVSAGFDQSSLFREVAFRSINIPVQYFGFILALGSLLAAITGAYIHKLDRLSTNVFLLLPGKPRL
ncbi:MAG: MFS transporter [Patescibacteria group bacterium]|jgi:MFS family permease